LLIAALWGINPDKTRRAPARSFVFLGLSMATVAHAGLPRSAGARAAQARHRRGRAWWVLNIGYLVNTVLPGRVGEFARVPDHRDRPFDSLYAFTSVALERILDLLSVALLFGLSLPWVQVRGIRGRGNLITVAAAGGLVVMLQSC
jgi:hypothetical protein